MPPARDETRAPRWWMFVLAGACYALFTTLAFPPGNVWPLAFLAPAPLVWAACVANRHCKRAAICVALGVCPMWFYEDAWLINVTQLGYPLLALYMSAYAGLFVWLAALARRAWTTRGSQPSMIAPALPMAVIAPTVWVGIEMIRGEIALTGYPWYLAGHPLIESPFLASPASLLGTYFVSFLVVAVCGALGDAAGWSGFPRLRGALAGIGVIALWLATSTTAWMLSSRPPADPITIRVAVVQTNVPQDNKLGWKTEQRLIDWANFAKLTRESAASRPKPDLIVWPETMFPGEALNTDFTEPLSAYWVAKGVKPDDTPMLYFTSRLLELQKQAGVPMLVGAQAIEGFRVDMKDQKPTLGFDRKFNSVFLIENAQVQATRYDKSELTPFGEVIPYVWRWKSIQKLIEDVGAGGMKFDLATGTDLTVFDIPVHVRRTGEKKASAETPDSDSSPSPRAVHVITPICFEATKSSHTRALAYTRGRRRADLLINASNDGWFGTPDSTLGKITGGREQHLQASRWRCVELGIPMIRAVNTGISAFVDRHGKLRQAGPDGRDTPINVDGVMIANVDVNLGSAGTLFGSVGNMFGWICLALALLLPPAGWLKLRSRPNSTRKRA